MVRNSKTCQPRHRLHVDNANFPRRQTKHQIRYMTPRASIDPAGQFEGLCSNPAHPNVEIGYPKTIQLQETLINQESTGGCRPKQSRIILLALIRRRPSYRQPMQNRPSINLVRIGNPCVPIDTQVPETYFSTIASGHTRSHHPQINSRTSDSRASHHQASTSHQRASSLAPTSVEPRTHERRPSHPRASNLAPARIVLAPAKINLARRCSRSPLFSATRCWSA